VGLHFSKHASEAPDTPDSAGSFQGACCQVGEFCWKHKQNVKIVRFEEEKSTFFHKKRQNISGIGK